MALKNVKRVTFSLPKVTLKKFEIAIPKSRRSKFIAEAIEQSLKSQPRITLEEVENFWTGLAARTPRKTNKTAVQLIREDRKSH